jgi:hypothetical protein
VAGGFTSDREAAGCGQIQEHLSSLLGAALAEQDVVVT